MTSMLEEKDSIREVLAEYCFCLDGGRFDEMAALFTADGTWHTDFGQGVGRAGIVEHARSLRSGSAPVRRGVHLTTNIVIRLEGERARPGPTGSWRRTATLVRWSAPPVGMPTRW